MVLLVSCRKGKGGRRGAARLAATDYGQRAKGGADLARMPAACAAFFKAGA